MILANVTSITTGVYSSLTTLLTPSKTVASANSSNKLKIKIGSIYNNQVVDGLTDFAEFATFRSNVLAFGIKFVPIDSSLKDTTGKYYYGSTDLVGAITLTI